jgi:cytochrome P450
MNLSDQIYAVHDQVSAIVKARQEKNSGILKENQSHSQITIFHTLLASSLPDSEKTVDRLADEGFVMIVAGSEATSKILSNLFYHLLANPRCLSKVQKELGEIMPDPLQLASWTKLEKLKYLVSQCFRHAN